MTSVPFSMGACPGVTRAGSAWRVRNWSKTWTRPPVSETGGRVHVFDQFRTLHAEPARVTPGQAPIEKGTEVIVASMDPDHGYLIVEPLGFSRSALSPQPSAVTEEETLKLQNRDT